MSFGIGIHTAIWRLLGGIGTIVVFGIASSILLHVANASERSSSTEDQYAVWSAFLKSELLENGHDWGAGGCLVVLQSHTIRHFADDGTARDGLHALLSG